MLGATQLSANVFAISARGSTLEIPCVVPFGLSRTGLNLDSYDLNDETPDFITISRAAAGNWGKLDLPFINSTDTINSSSGPVFFDHMTTTECRLTATANEGSYSPGTGFSEIEDSFAQCIASQPEMVMPVIDFFPSGNSGNVVIQKFLRVRAIAQRGNGANWELDLELLELKDVGRGISGDADGAPTARIASG